MPATAPVNSTQTPGGGFGNQTPFGEGSPMHFGSGMQSPGMSPGQGGGRRLRAKDLLVLLAQTPLDLHVHQ